MPPVRFGYKNSLSKAALGESDPEKEDLKRRIAELQGKRRGGILGSGIGPNINLGVGRALSDLGGTLGGLAKLALAPLPGGDPAGEVWSQAGRGLASGMAGMAPVILGGVGGALGSIVPGAGTAAGAAAGAALGALVSKPIVSLYDDEVGDMLGGPQYKPKSTWDTFGERGLLPGLIETASGAALGAGAARTGLATAGGAASKAGNLAVTRRLAERAGLSADDIVRAETAGQTAARTGQRAGRAAHEAGIGGRGLLARQGIGTGPLGQVARASKRATRAGDDIDSALLARATERMQGLERVSHPYQTVFHDVIRPVSRAMQAKTVAQSVASRPVQAAAETATAPAMAGRAGVPEAPMRTPDASQGGLPLDAAMGTGRVPWRAADPGEFHQRVADVQGVTDKRGRKLGETVYRYEPEEYEGMQTFLSEDGKSGFAIKADGDVVSVFSEPGQGRGIDIAAEAAARGGKKLDAFDENGFLPDLYRRVGFNEKWRAGFDPDQAPEGWAGGTPDVVGMERTPLAGAQVPGRIEEAGVPSPARPIPGQGTLDEALAAQADEALAATGKAPRRTLAEEQMERTRNTPIPEWAQRAADRAGPRATARGDRLEGRLVRMEVNRARRERMRFADADRAARIKNPDMVPQAAEAVRRLREHDPDLTQEKAEAMVYDAITKEVEQVSYLTEMVRRGIDETHPLYHLIAEKMGVETEIPRQFLVDNPDVAAMLKTAVDGARADAVEREAIMRGSRLGGEGLEDARATDSLLTATEQKQWTQFEKEYRKIAKQSTAVEHEYWKAAQEVKRLDDNLGSLSTKSEEVAARRRVVEGEILDMSRPRGLSTAKMQQTFDAIVAQVNETGGALYDPHADRMMKAAKDGGTDTGYYVGSGGEQVAIEEWNADAGAALRRFADNQGLALQHRDAQIQVQIVPGSESVTLSVGQTHLTGTDGKSRPLTRPQASILAQARGEDRVANLNKGGTAVNVKVDPESQWTAAHHVKDLQRPGSQFNRHLRRTEALRERMEAMGTGITRQEHDDAVHWDMRVAMTVTQNNPRHANSVDGFYGTVDVEAQKRFNPATSPGGSLFSLYMTDTFDPVKQLTPELWDNVRDYLGVDADKAQDWYFNNHNAVTKRFGGDLYGRVNGRVEKTGEVPRKTTQLFDSQTGAWKTVNMDDLVFSLVAVTSVDTSPIDNMRYALQGALAQADWLKTANLDRVAGLVETYQEALRRDSLPGVHPETGKPTQPRITKDSNVAKTELYQALAGQTRHSKGTLVELNVQEILNGRMVHEFTNEYIQTRWGRDRENLRKIIARGAKAGMDEAQTMESGGSELHAKIRSYYENLRDPMNSQGVTLDRVMQDLMGLKGQGYTGAEYQTAAAAIRNYAKQLSDATGERILPHQVQAALWVYTKRVTNEQDLGRLYGAGGEMFNNFDTLAPEQWVEMLELGQDPISAYFDQMIEVGRDIAATPKGQTKSIRPLDVTTAYPGHTERQSRAKQAVANLIDGWVHEPDDVIPAARRNFRMSVKTGAGNAMVENLRDLYRTMAGTEPYGAELVRGLKGTAGGRSHAWADELEVGGTTTLTPASFSRTEGVASSFTGVGPTPVFVHVEPGARGAHVQKIWDNRRESKLVNGEDEVILAGEYEVVRIERPGSERTNAADVQQRYQTLSDERDALVVKFENKPTPAIEARLGEIGKEIQSTLAEMRTTRQGGDSATRVWLRQKSVPEAPYSPTRIRTGEDGVVDLQRLTTEDMGKEQQFHYLQPADVDKEVGHRTAWEGTAGIEGVKGAKAKSTGRIKLAEIWRQIADPTTDATTVAKLKAEAREMVVSWIKSHEKRFTGRAENFDEFFDRSSGVSGDVIEKARAAGMDEIPGVEPPLYQRMQDDVVKGLFYKDNKTSRLTMRFFETADVSTLFHERGHLLRALLPEADIDAAVTAYRKVAGKQGGNKPYQRQQVAKMTQGGIGDVEFEEWFADEMLRHMMGDRPTPGFEDTFDRIRTSLTYLWDGVQGKGMKGIQPEMAEMFNRWLVPAIGGEKFDIPRLRLDMAGQSAKSVARAMGAQEGQTPEQTYQRGLTAGRKLAELDRQTEKAAKLQTQTSRVQKASDDLQAMMEDGSLPLAEQMRRNIIRLEKKTETLTGKIDRPSVNRVPPVWQPIWSGIQALVEEAKVNPAMAEFVESLPQTFPEMIKYAAEKGLQPEHIPLISQSKVQRLVFQPLGFSEQVTKAGSRHARTFQDATRDRSVAALVAAHVDVVLERENNELISLIERQVAQPLVDGQAIPDTWAEWDPATTFLRTEVSEGVRRAVTPNAPKYMVPATVKKMLDEYSRSFNHSSVSAIRKVIDPWRALVLTWSPGWYRNNVIGGMILATKSGVRWEDWAVAWREYRKGTATGRNKLTQRFGAGDESLYGGATPLTQPGELAGVGGSGHLINELLPNGMQTLAGPRGKNLFQDAKKRYQEARGPGENRSRIGAANQGRHVVEATMQRANTVVDDLARTAVYVSAKRRGFSPEAAMKKASEAMIDYANLSPFERNIVRSVVPFYAWQKGILQVVAKLPLDNPAAAGMMMMLGRLNEEMNSDLPEMYRDVIDMPFGLGSINTKSMNPFTDAEKLASPQGIAESMNFAMKIMARNAFGAPSTGYPEYQRIDEIGRVMPTTNPAEDLIKEGAGFSQVGAVGELFGKEDIAGRPVRENAVTRYLGDPRVSDASLDKLRARMAKSESTLSKFEENWVKRDERKKKGLTGKDAAPKSGAPTFGVGR